VKGKWERVLEMNGYQSLLTTESVGAGKLKEFILTCCLGKILCRDEVYGKRVELWI
jgi:hypothetical protein